VVVEAKTLEGAVAVKRPGVGVLSKMDGGRF